MQSMYPDPFLEDTICQISAEMIWYFPVVSGLPDNYIGVFSGGERPDLAAFVKREGSVKSGCGQSLGRGHFIRQAGQCHDYLHGLGH